jgi:hypothetical protein
LHLISELGVNYSALGLNKKQQPIDCNRETLAQVESWIFQKPTTADQGIIENHAKKRRQINKIFLGRLKPFYNLYL